jgi:SAM-dependent methyltransferase
MGVEHLPPVVPVHHEREAGANADHPMRRVTRQVAFEPDGWTPERKAKVAELFDGLAPEWHTREVPGRYDALHDALDRGRVPRDGPALELGSGTGLSTPMLAERFPNLIAGDLSREMLRLAPADAAPRLQLDSSRLPFPDGALTVVLVINMLLFPEEMARVVAPDGVLVWVNTSGDRTPIHLPADDVVEAMGAGWRGTASEAGTGTWCVARRTG